MASPSRQTPGRQPGAQKPYRVSFLPTPTLASITWDGEDLTARQILTLWRHGSEQKLESRRRIETCRDLRRKTLRVMLNPIWAQRNPEAASWVGAVLPERLTIEREVRARAAAVEPEYQREALGETGRDDDNAQELKGYLNEWRKQSVPFQVAIKKGVEDGEYGRVTLPAADDLNGIPDFYDRLDADAVAALDEQQRRLYKQDGGDKQKRYAKYDQQGNKLPAEQYQRNAAGKSRFQHGKGSPFRVDFAASKQAHDEVVQRYLLQRQASTTRVVPALDCAPFFVRGKGRERWDLRCLVERTLMYPEELLEADLGWEGMGDRELIPHGFTQGRLTGQYSQFYLYTAYLTCRSEEPSRHGRPGRVVQRPIIAYTVGGYGTWSLASDSEAGVHVIDLYAKYGLEGSLWSYHGGMSTEDDEPDYYWQPYMWPNVELILGIEGNKTSINAATATNAFPGYSYLPDSKLAEVLPEAIMETDGASMRRPRIPAIGEIVTNSGAVAPFQASTVTPDAWRQYQADMALLMKNTSPTQEAAGSEASGHKLVVQSKLDQVAISDIRMGALNFSVGAAEDHLKIVDAIERTYGVAWPIQTVDERPVSEDASSDGTARVIVFKPEWLGRDGFPNYRLAAAYPEEENLARIQQEADLADRGYSNFRAVQKARGISDPMNERLESAKDQLWKMPSSQMLLANRVAKLRGDKMLQQILSLQASQEQTKAGIPGFENGVPVASLADTPTGPGTPNPQQGGGGGPSAAGSALGGAVSGGIGAGAAMQDEAAVAQIPGGG